MASLRCAQPLQGAVKACPVESSRPGRITERRVYYCAPLANNSSQRPSFPTDLRPCTDGSTKCVSVFSALRRPKLRRERKDILVGHTYTQVGNKAGTLYDLSCSRKLATHLCSSILHRQCLQQCLSATAVASSAVSESETSPASTSSPEVVNKRVVVLGGSGRVGSSTARALVSEHLDEAGLKLEVVISGRSRERGEQLASSIGPNVTFVSSNVDDIKSVEEVVKGADLVIHTAGPFQRRERCTVLEACISTKTPYMDVCDDTSYSKRAKALHERAREVGVPAITTTGIYPGVSNVIAAELVRLARRGSVESDAPSGSQPSRLRYSYYTAGTGGAGPTILATSFLLLGEEVVAFKDGKEVRAAPYSGRSVVDFGKGIGNRSTYLLNLPEVASAFANLGVPSVSARFGTGPEFWNWAMAAVAKLPKDFLEDPVKVQGLVNLSDPFVRAFDGIVGERMAIRMDLECTDGVKAVGLLSHKSLSTCVGTATSAFALAMLEGSTEPGVWFPEEAGALTVEARQKLLQRASRGSLNFIMNRPPWMVESSPINIGFGLYWQ